MKRSGVEIDFRNSGFDVQKRDGIVLPQQVAQKKAGPGVAGARIGNQKNVFGKNRQSSARNLSTADNTADLGKGAENSLKFFLYCWYAAQLSTTN